MLHVLPSSIPLMAKWCSSCMNIPIMAEATPSNLHNQVKLSDKSFHVGVKQVITFLDGYSTPLQCRTGLMYMNLLGKHTDADLNTYPHVLLTGPHEWDPSVLDYTHPTTSGDPTWAPEPSQCGADDPRIDEFGNFKGRVHHTLTHSPAISNIAQHKHSITTQPTDFEKLIFHKTTQWAVASTRYPMRKHFKSRFQAFNIPGDLKRLPLIPSSLIHLLLNQMSPWSSFLLVKEL